MSTRTTGETAIVARSRRRPTGAIFLSAISHFVVAAGGLILMVPFLWMVSTSLKHEWEAFLIPPQWIPDEFLWDNYRRAIFDYYNFALYGANTTIITVGTLVGRLITASMVAFGFARIRFPGRGVLFILVLGTLMIPHQVTIVPLYILFQEFGWLNTFLPLIVPAWVGGGGFYIFLLRQFIMTVNPELDDAARIDGCGWLGIYLRIIMPLITPALAAVAIFSFLSTWNDFFNPLIFLRSNEKFTLAIGLHFYTSAASASTKPETTVVMAGSTMIMIPPLLLFFFAQRYFIQGVVFSGIKG